ncbi:hypothetical protein [Paenibacillus lutrae]|uniref:Uncharacterized protein n=1 Tax=Paenibacillus lutrae TaxID=2078573 RepID=A0A7X3FJR7_9BACL|nr:hypothetical protein [Paenibacillus lutrae]MVP01003.1 hypothetical protein [Paenibacillus lutrae]
MKALFFTCAVTTCIVPTVFAAPTNFIYCDNDAASGCTTSPSNMSSMDWVYKSNTGYTVNSWANDHRVSDRVRNTTRTDYEWSVPTDGAKWYDLQVYLYSSEFDNRKAQYWQSGDYVGSIDQYLAPAGWNYVGTTWDYGTATVTLSSLDYYPNSTFSSRTGADRIRLAY